MRTITFNVFTFDELSEDAKRTALDGVRSDVAGMLCDFDADEFRGALKEIEKIFEIKVYDWSVGYPGTYSRWRFSESSKWGELSDDPKYLVRYLDEVERWCRKGRYYSTPFKQCPKDADHPAGLTYKKRYSKVMFERNYSLTGTWAGAITDKFTGEHRWEYVRKGRTIENYLDDLLYEFFKDWERNQECNYEDEVVEETILANDYEFTEQGVRYCA